MKKMKLGGIRMFQLVATALLLASSTFAQTNQTPLAKPVAVENDPWQKRLERYNIGGSHPLGEVVKDLQREFRDISFVLPKDVSNTPITEMDLRAVTLEDIMKAFEIVTKGQVRAMRMSDRMVAFSGAGRAKPVSRVFSVSEYLAGLSEQQQEQALKELNDALRLCWEVKGVTEPPSLSFHRGTRLLIVQGQPDDVATVQEVIDRLPPPVAGRSELRGIAPNAPAKTEK